MGEITTLIRAAQQGDRDAFDRLVSLVDRGDEIVRVHEGLEDLRRVDENLARLVEMRYCAGMQVQEIAEALAVSERSTFRTRSAARGSIASIRETPSTAA
jgi:DNA-directed RNA polymerase specialized sigma subunit